MAWLANGSESPSTTPPSSSSVLHTNPPLTTPPSNPDLLTSPSPKLSPSQPPLVLSAAVPLPRAVPVLQHVVVAETFSEKDVLAHQAAYDVEPLSRHAQQTCVGWPVEASGSCCARGALAVLETSVCGNAGLIPFFGEVGWLNKGAGFL